MSREEGTRPCEKCGGAGVDFGGRDNCMQCRGHGFLPAPCAECHLELCEGTFCSAACEANAARRTWP